MHTQPLSQSVLLALVCALSVVLVGGAARTADAASADAERALSRARSLQDQGLPRAAIEPMREAARLDPSNMDTQRAYVDLMTVQGYAVDVAEEYRQRVSSDPNNPDWLYLQGKASGDPAVARGLFEKALSLDPKHVWATQGMGGVAAAEGRLDEAATRFEAALALDPTAAEIHNKLAHLHAVQGQSQQAIQAWDAAIQHAPTDYHAWMNKGVFIASDSDEQLDASAELLEKAVRLAPGNPATHFNYGYVLFRLERFDDSLAHFAAALAINPRDRQVSDVRDLVKGVADGKIPFAAYDPFRKAMAASTTDPALAEQHFREVLLLAPDFAIARKNLGVVLTAGGKPAEGLKELQRAAELRPDHPNIQFNLGSVLLGTGNIEGALGHLREARRLDPQDPEVIAGLALGELGSGNVEASMRYYREALDLQPRDPVLLMQFASAQAASGDLDGAAATDRSVLAIVPDFPTARLHLIEVLRAGRRYDEALTELAILERDYEGDPRLAAARAGIESERDTRSDAASKPGMIRLSRILVRDPTAASELERKLGVGGDFAVLARTHGEGPERARSGDIGFVDPSEMRAELAQSLKGLAVGGRTAALDLGGGIYVIMKRTE